MSSAHEIVTIQAGNFANFIGTHWWNIQESSFCYSPDSSVSLDINHDVMFKEGLNFRGEVTYTPRLVLVDLESNLTSIRRECPLYRSDDDSKTLWDGPVEVIREKPVKKNPFLQEFEQASKWPNSGADVQSEAATMAEIYDFNSSSTVWSDFLKTNLHPNSFCLFKEQNSTEDKNPEELYSYGEEMYLKSGKEQVEDTIRRMSEECDYLQGFHLIFDAYNCFSGTTSHILQYLDDEFKRFSTVCFPVYQSNNNLPVQDLREQKHRLYATLNSFCNMNSCCSFFSPLSLSDDVIKLSHPFKSFPHLQYNETLLYHTSAIFAVAIDTLTSSYRLRSMKFSMSDIASAMSTYGRKLVASSTCLPFPLSHDSYLNTMIEKDRPECYMTSLTPFYQPQSERTLFQSSVLRGIPANKFQKLGKSIYHSMQPEELYGQYLNKYSSSSVTTATVFPEMCSVGEPFPRIFKDVVSDSGFLNSNACTKPRSVNSIPVAASFASSDSAGRFIEDLLVEASKSTFKEYVKCTETTYEKDNFQELIEELIGLQENYTHYS